MTCYILDSSLVRSHGHHDHFARGFRQVAADLQCPTEIFGHQQISPALQAELGARPVFARSLYEAIDGDPYEGVLTGFLDCAERFANDLDRLGIRVDDQDLLLLPTATAPELGGLARWLGRHRMRARVALIFHWGTQWSFQPGSLAGALLRTANRELNEAGPADVWTGATHKPLANALAPVLDREIRLAPSVTFFGRDLVARTDRTDVNVGFLGTSRSQKGSGWIPEIVRQALHAYPRIRFSIQCYDWALDSAYENIAGDARVNVHREWLDDDRLEELISSIDLAILPYDRSTYQAMVSGVFTLLAGHGKPMIVPSSTWMSDRICRREAEGEIYEGDESVDVLTSLDVLLGRMDEAVPVARTRANAWRKQYSGDALVRDLLYWAEQPSLRLT